MAEDFERQFPDQYMLRLPAGMRDKLKAIAKSNGRSMNSEIVARLEESLQMTEDAKPQPEIDAIIKKTVAEAMKVFAVYKK